MKIRISMSIAYDTSQEKVTQENRYPTLRWEDSYTQELEVSSVESATGIQSEVIKSFNGFSK